MCDAPGSIGRRVGGFAAWIDVFQQFEKNDRSAFQDSHPV